MLLVLVIILLVMIIRQDARPLKVDYDILRYGKRGVAKSEQQISKKKTSRSVVVSVEDAHRSLTSYMQLKAGITYKHFFRNG